MWYVYRYVHPVDNRVFYVGKGNGNRLKTHLYRARMWVNAGKPAKCGSHNLHLLRMISKIWDIGLDPVIEIIKMFDDEKSAYDCEKELIAASSSTLCNLTVGGEGWAGSVETRREMGIKRKEWLLTEDGQQWRKMMSESRMGEKNPNYGKVESEEHKAKRMKNFLQKERWNKGLKGDSRSKGHPKGKPACNAKACIAVHEPTGEIITASSAKELAAILAEHKFGISSSSAGRIRNKDKTFKGWRIKHAVPSEQG